MNQMQKQLNSNLKRFEERKADYEKVFSTPVGKRVLEDIKLNGYFNKTTFMPGNTDVTSHNEGKRDLALHIDYMATPLPEAKEANEKAITGDKK